MCLSACPQSAAQETEGEEKKGRRFSGENGRGRGGTGGAVGERNLTGEAVEDGQLKAKKGTER